MDFPKSVPGVGLVGGQFVDENPSIGQQGSLIPAAWGNAVTQELLAVIREAGIEPDEDQTDQLRMAIRSMWATVEKPGVLRKASSADMLDADCDDAAVTPAALAARTATESRTGLLEIATQAEVNAGTDDERAVTAKKLRNGVFCPIGVGQEWQNVKALRLPNVIYTNTSGRVICFKALGGQTNIGNSRIELYVNGSLIDHVQGPILQAGETVRVQVSAIIPSGATYNYTVQDITEASRGVWELR